MDPSSSSALLRRLVLAARQLGARRLSCATSHACVKALAEAGATVSRLVVRYGQEAPYVIDKAELVLEGLVIEASQPCRPASPEEARALDSSDAYYYLGTYRGVKWKHADKL